MEKENFNSVFAKGEQRRFVSPSESVRVSPPKDCKDATGRGSRLSFKDEVRAIADRLYLYAVREADKALAYELCAIIAEVNIMRPCFSVKIGGEALEASLVKEVFSCLTHDHLESVIEAFDSCRSEIKNKKAYLRTALYNSVFELEAGVRNLVNCNEG